MNIVTLFVAPDGIHIGVKSLALIKIISLEGETLPLRQGVDYLTVGVRRGHVKLDRALVSVKVVIKTRHAVNK